MQKTRIFFFCAASSSSTLWSQKLPHYFECISIARVATRESSSLFCYMTGGSIIWLFCIENCLPLRITKFLLWKKNVSHIYLMPGSYRRVNRFIFYQKKRKLVIDDNDKVFHKSYFMKAWKLIFIVCKKLTLANIF